MTPAFGGDEGEAPGGRPRGKPRENLREYLRANPSVPRSKKTGSAKPGPWKEAHPNVNCRVTHAELRRLKEQAALRGVSFSDILRQGLGVLEREMLPFRLAGFGRFLIPCPLCGKPLLFDLVAWPELVPALKKALKESHHQPYCPP